MKTPRPPAHLSPASKRWWRAIVGEYELQSHHLRLLALACGAWDRGEEARAALAQLGLTFTDRLGNPRARPEARIEADARIAFARLVREIGLDAADVGEPATPRPPALH